MPPGSSSALLFILLTVKNIVGFKKSKLKIGLTYLRHPVLFRLFFTKIDLSSAVYIEVNEQARTIFVKKKQKRRRCVR